MLQTKKCPQELYDPCPVSFRKTTTADLEEFEDGLNLLPRSIKARVRSALFKSSLSPSWKSLQGFGDDYITGITPIAEQQDLIEIKTLLQSKCTRWHEERFSRLTVSNFGRVLQRKSRFDTIALELLQPN